MSKCQSRKKNNPIHSFRCNRYCNRRYKCRCILKNSYRCRYPNIRSHNQLHMPMHKKWNRGHCILQSKHWNNRRIH